MDKIFELIRKDWGDNLSLQLLCARIYQYLIENKEHPDFYTFNNFKEALNQDSLKDADIAEAIMYLATPRLNVLKLNLMYEWRNLILDLPSEEIVNYSKNDPEKYPVNHPKTGELMSEEEIFVCFLPGSVLKKISNEAEL